MAKNRFEQVDEPQPDAITLILAASENGAVGRVTCPALLTNGQSPADMLSDIAAAKDAFRAAVRMANEMKAPMVVVDPDHVWSAEWGDLYRYEDEAEESGAESN